MGLKEAKDLADEILITKEGSFGLFYSTPFIIGDSMDSMFSEEQWVHIYEYLGNDMTWKYV